MYFGDHRREIVSPLPSPPPPSTPTPPSTPSPPSPPPPRSPPSPPAPAPDLPEVIGYIEYFPTTSLSSLTISVIVVTKTSTLVPTPFEGSSMIAIDTTTTTVLNGPSRLGSGETVALALGIPGLVVAILSLWYTNRQFRITKIVLLRQLDSSNSVTAGNPATELNFVSEEAKNTSATHEVGSHP